MKMKAILICAFLVVLGNACTTQSNAPQRASAPTGEELGLAEVSYDGLRRSQVGARGVVYLASDPKLASYRSLLLLTPEIQFSRLPSTGLESGLGSRPISASALREMIATGQDLFVDEFSRELRQAGYRLVDEPGADVLLVRPSIINATVTAPMAGRDPWTQVYAESAGSATLVLELYDSETRTILVRAIDRKPEIGRHGDGWSSPRTRQSNVADARQAFRSWARKFVNGLKDAGLGSGAGPE